MTTSKEFTHLVSNALFFFFLQVFFLHLIFSSLFTEGFYFWFDILVRREHSPVDLGGKMHRALLSVRDATCLLFWY